MVDRYTLTALDDVAARFGVAPPEGRAPRFNIAPLQHALICTADGIATARWGLLPPWRGHGGKRAPHVTHAPVGAVETTPLLRNAFKKQRGLVLADGFYHWPSRERDKKPPPLWLHVPRADHRPQLLGLAAVAATHRDDGQPSFALLEAPMRVSGDLSIDLSIDGPIAIDPADHATWLTGSVAAAHALLALPPVAWRAEPVSTYVNAIDHDDARCIAPLRNPLQGELF